MIRRSSFVSALLLVVAVFGTLVGVLFGIYASFLVTSELGIALHGNYEYFMATSPAVGNIIMVITIAAGGALGAGIPLTVRALLRKRRPAAA